MEKACKAVPGTQDAVVSLEEKQVTVTGSADVSQWKKAITEAGYEVVEGVNHMRRDFWYDSKGAGKIHSCCWTPEGEPRGICQIVHGIAEYVERV